MRISRAVEPPLALSPRKQPGRGQSCTLYAGMAPQRRGVRGDGRGAMGGLPRAWASPLKSARRRVGTAMDVDVPVLVFLLLRPLLMYHGTTLVRQLTKTVSGVPQAAGAAAVTGAAAGGAHPFSPSYHCIILKKILQSQQFTNTSSGSQIADIHAGNEQVAAMGMPSESESRQMSVRQLVHCHNPKALAVMRLTIAILLLASLVSLSRATATFTDNCNYFLQNGSFGTVEECNSFCNKCCAEFPDDVGCPTGDCIGDCRGETSSLWPIYQLLRPNFVQDE
ncbi:hypothetical protein GGX14DRAFT_394885 [Mycena pura]|uniref:Uncharacterized protein n=1 Tax=Mycena pura TaxID=153505 RepID=A0AAD6VFQ9_9AGAR|nr:hypothetical protein GGX14DRAFT_394885 [Mycena pura]